MANQKSIGVIGLGITGCQTAAFFAAAGITVYVYDKKPEKLDKVKRGLCPVFEAQLSHGFQNAAKAGKIKAVDKLAQVWGHSDVVFMAPGLTDEMSGQVSYVGVRRLALEIAEQWNSTTGKLTLVVRHPLYLGATAELLTKPLAAHPNVSVVLNPALYRQSRAVTDTTSSPLHVVSSAANTFAASEVAALYQTAGIRVEIVSESIAEMLPSVCGSFQALKVAFGNEVAALAASYAVPADQILHLLAKDTLLNASGAYLRPGNAYGGLHLPRSVGHLAKLSATASMKTPLINQIHASNEAHFERLRKQVLASKSNKVGLFGLSYRPDTDDTRGSSPIRFVESLLALGKEVRIYDPQIQYGRLEGSNWFSLLTQLPLAEKLLTPNFEELLSWSEELILFHPPSKSQAQLIQGKPVVVTNWSGASLAESQEA